MSVKVLLTKFFSYDKILLGNLRRFHQYILFSESNYYVEGQKYDVQNLFFSDFLKGSIRVLYTLEANQN